MKLTDNEIRDINRYLEEGKPLPEKYRFLLFEDKREVELVCNGKTNEVCNVVLPFQVIEQVDEPRAEKNVSFQKTLFDIDSRGRQKMGWTNKLIWGDNKLILSSLKNGPMREEIEKQGGIKLIYIDPPFDVGADFSMNIEIGDEQFTKEPGVLEEIAYRDTWGRGADSFIAMIYERLSLMRDLLAEDGSIYVHCDYRVNSYIRLAMDELFSKENYRNEGRKWIVFDLGKFAIHTTRKRMIGVQRELKKDGRDYRAFEVLNLGKYERQHYIGVNPNLRDEEKEKQLAQKEKDFLDHILHAYRADKVEGFRTFHGKKASRLVAVGPINLPVTRLFVEEVILECRAKHITKVDVLAFEFEMGLFPNIQEEAKSKGIDLAMKYIPRDVFDRRAVEKNQMVFHDVSYIEVKPRMKGNSVAVKLTDFSVFYNQDSIAHAEASLKNGSNKIVVENGQIIKVIKDRNGIIKRESLTKKWTDWIDYWSVDFDFENKKEIIQIRNADDPDRRGMDRRFCL